MTRERTISGFSKLSKLGKIKWIVENFFKDPEAVMKELKGYWLANEEQQSILDGISENTISNYPLPLGVAPNFMINGRTYAVPMVIEESSVVAAASNAAKFWLSRGGFKAEVTSMKKVGQIHFFWGGPAEVLKEKFGSLKEVLIQSTRELTCNMRERGGGVLDIELLPFEEEKDYYQIRAYFDTCDSMGANFINTILEEWAQQMQDWFKERSGFEGDDAKIEVLMSILSNYTPECLVRVGVECPVEELCNANGNMSPQNFARRFERAVHIARIDPYRATTHNKGIFNGIDAVVLATGNDFRAIEACGHTYAARDGQYRSLSDCAVENGRFRFWLELPLAVGTVGGLTSLHPVARRSLELLGHPTAEELMKIIACTGLAQNFSAIRSLITTGIQHGHMKMHLLNILQHLKASKEEKDRALHHFSQHTVSFNAVREFLEK